MVILWRHLPPTIGVRILIIKNDPEFTGIWCGDEVRVTGLNLPTSNHWSYYHNTVFPCKHFSISRVIGGYWLQKLFPLAGHIACLIVDCLCTERMLIKYHILREWIMLLAPSNHWIIFSKYLIFPTTLSLNLQQSNKWSLNDSFSAQ